jgi:hypothetical protein
MVRCIDDICRGVVVLCENIAIRAREQPTGLEWAFRQTIGSRGRDFGIRRVNVEMEGFPDSGEL